MEQLDDNSNGIVQIISSSNMPSVDLRNVPYISEEYLHPMTDEERMQYCPEGYEYIDIEDLHETAQHSPNSPHDTVQEECAQMEKPMHRVDVGTSSKKKQSTANEAMDVNGLPDQSDQSYYSSSDSSSDYYPDVTGSTTENEANGNSSSAKVEDACIVKSSYIDLGLRPPHIPNVYDRLRNSGLDIDS